MRGLVYNKWKRDLTSAQSNIFPKEMIKIYFHISLTIPHVNQIISFLLVYVLCSEFIRVAYWVTQ